MCFRAAEVCTPCVAAWLTSLRVSQITFPVILLFPFREHERSAALRTRYFKVWHTRFLHESENEVSTLLLFGALASRFFPPQLWDESAVFSNATPKSWRPDGFIGLSVLQQYKFFYVILRRPTEKSVAEHLQKHLRCGVVATPELKYPAISPGTLVARRSSNMSQTLNKGPDI